MATVAVLAGAGLLVSLAACTQFPYTAPNAHAELRAAIEAAHKARIGGPAEVPLADRTVLLLQAGLEFIPPSQGERLLRAMGEVPGERLLGVVVGGEPGAAEVAAIYARDRLDPALPELEIAGWNAAPALSGFRQR